MIRIIIPAHLRTLIKVNREIELPFAGTATLESVMDALEAHYPVLKGTIRDHVTKKNRPFIRFFACGEDLTHNPLDTSLPEAVLAGMEPLRIVGAMAGG